MTLTGVHRFCSLLFFFHFPLALSSVFYTTTGLMVQLYGGALSAGFLAMIARYYKRALANNFALRIDYETATESFLILMPPSSWSQMGEPEKVKVAAADFQMLSKD